MLAAMTPADLNSATAAPADPGLADYIAGWRERDRREHASAADWRARVLARLPAVARTLSHDFGATRVLLFGSLARGKAKPGSDVDLLVDGLAMADLIQATVRAERLLEEAHADLVPTAWRGPRCGRGRSRKGVSSMSPDADSRLRLLAAELRAECPRIGTTVAEIHSARAELAAPGCTRRPGGRLSGPARPGSGSAPGRRAPFEARHRWSGVASGPARDEP
jgi:predicted nucleotidyltransferase